MAYVGASANSAASRAAWVEAEGLLPTPRRLPRPDFRAGRTAGDAWRTTGSAAPEINCLRGRLPDAVLELAARRAAQVGVGAERVLLTAGYIDQDTYLAALAADLGIPFETLVDRPRESCPLDGSRLIDAAAAGLLPLIVDGELQIVVAPRSVPEFMNFVEKYPAARLCVTTSARLNEFIAKSGAEALARHAAHTLADAQPHLSAALRRWQRLVALTLTAVAALGVLITVSEAALAAAQTVLALSLFGWLALRFFGSYVKQPLPGAVRIPDRELPIYTIIVALYREAECVEALVGALRQLDYPPEKLDIKLVIEPDDLETWAALSKLHLGPPFEVIEAPDSGPRTKPKAMNAALPFARGTFTAVYDAEDRPEPNQLRRALDTFSQDGGAVTCAQASLTIDNTRDNWLARLFTAEYAAQFDLFLPGLAALHLPLPLGGSSNHFRTSVLRDVGAWDSHNVTEDADLGMRLARFGYRSGVIDSTTYEEAPTRLRPWLRQRTRWFKGWMQTWVVHMSTPRRLFRELGPRGFITLQLIVGGSVLSALIHPIFLGGVGYALLSGLPILSIDPDVPSVGWLYVAILGAGYLTSVVLGLRGLARRRLLATAWVLVLVPVHWVLLSLAAWRALFQLAHNPYGWEKTAHGLAATSRLAAMTPRVH